jgi:drug/metabolite transporter (DMT)-like permease
MGMGFGARAGVSHGATIAVVIVWAAAFPAIKALLDHGFAAVDVAILRYAVVAPGFALLLWRSGWLPRLTRRDAVRIVVAGVLVVAGYHVSLNAGTRFTSSGSAALIVALAPALTLLLAVRLGLERLVPGRVAGLALAFAGVAVVMLLGSGQEILGAPASFALYNVLMKPLLARYSVFALTAATSLVGTAALLPFARRSTVTALTEASRGDLALVLYLGVVCTLLGYVAWNIGLRGLGASRAVVYAYGVPALAVVLGALVLDEPVTVWLALGGALIVGGVALAQLSRSSTIAAVPAPAPSGR